MEDLRSVSSPRRILSLSKKRRTLVSLDKDDKAPGFGLSGDHGPKPSEVYGFVGSITTVVATVVYLIWAYVPNSWLHSVGIFYYPSSFFSLKIPEIKSFFSPDEFSKEPSIYAFSEEDQPIEPIFDIDINRINNLMFNNKKR